ncbi:ABC transporter substrate-binding protein [Trinickia acidisoli]|uniref:ABC transporter substrate-binding protein n=1 Tax=Trinickia acidisoli TaxID=2767482 RepID=UPI001A8D585E|nr:ABC transporter substrate-binding protein [Trinickia acidisoli]
MAHGFKNSLIHQLGLLIIGLTTAASACAAAPAPAAAPHGVTVIRYLRTSGTIDASEIAAAKGWLQADGVRLESTGFSQGGPENLFALAAGSVDMAGAANAAVLNAISNGNDIIAVKPGFGVSPTANSKFYVLAKSPITKPSDLIGKTIAVNTLGAHLDYTVREYLRIHNIAQNAVKLVVVPGPQLEQTLRSGQVDVAAVGEWQAVFAGKLEADGGVRVLLDDYQVLGNITLGYDVMRKSFVAAHAAAVRAFVSDSARAADWATEHPDDAKKLIAQLLKERGENPTLASYWPGFGLRQHALMTDHDAQFWLDVFEREGKLRKGQLSVSGVQTNQYNSYAQQ